MTSTAAICFQRQTCALLSLPPELRNRIYHLRLGSIMQGGVDFFDLQVPGWLFACKQIFHEAASILYGLQYCYTSTRLSSDENLLDTIHFHFETEYRSHNAIATMHVPRMIRNIAIEVYIRRVADISDLHVGLKRYLQGLECLTGLRKLCIFFTPENDGDVKAKADWQVVSLESGATCLDQLVACVDELLPDGCEIEWLLIPKRFARHSGKRRLRSWQYRTRHGFSAVLWYKSQME